MLKAVRLKMYRTKPETWRCLLLFAAAAILSLPRRSLCSRLPASAASRTIANSRDSISVSGSYETDSGEESDLVLNKYVVEEIPAGRTIASIPHDLHFERKYTPSELGQLRYSILSKTTITSSSQGASEMTLPGSVNSAVLSPFIVDEIRGTIRTRDRIDRETICRRPPELPQSASGFSSMTSSGVSGTTSGGGPPCIVRFDVAVQPMAHFQIVRVRVEILDVNDNDPEFPVGRVSLVIPESAAPGTSLHLPVAVDVDSGVNGIRQYTLVDSRPQTDAFRLVERSRSDIRLVLTSPLDRETADKYQLTVVAEDGGDPSRSGTLQVDVTVVDSNDNAPSFTVLNGSYVAEVAEDAPPGTVVLIVTATDLDAGLNGQVSYSLAPDERLSPRDLGDLFAIGETTGELYTLTKLDRESSNGDLVYRMYVVAVDRPETEMPLSAVASVEIRVIDVNDNAPQIRVNSPELPVAEEGDDLESLREIAAEVGTGSRNASKIVYVARDLPSGAFVCHVTVEDPDVGDNGRFSCRLIGRSASRFQLHRMYPTEFKVVTSSRLDDDLVHGTDSTKNVEFDFTIVCRDFGATSALTSTLPVRVKLLAAGSRIPLSCSRDPLDVTIDENNAIGATLIMPDTLITQSGLTGNDIEYHLADSDHSSEHDRLSSGLVAVNSRTGHVTARVSFNREKLSRFRFRILATDKSGSSSSSSSSVSCSVRVTIADLNDNAPNFQFPAPGNDTVTSVIHTSTPQDVARLIANDSDSIGPNSEIAYSIVSIKPESDGAAVFAVDSNSGIVRYFGGMLDESRKQYDIRVHASDRGTPQHSVESVLHLVLVSTKSSIISGNEPETDANGQSGQQQQRRSTAVVTLTGSGEDGSRFVVFLVVGGFLVALIAFIVVVVIIILATADRRRRCRVERKEIGRTVVKPPMDQDGVGERRKSGPCVADDGGEVIAERRPLSSNGTISILHSSRRSTSGDSHQSTAVTPTKKVVIFVKDATNQDPPSSGGCRQVTTPTVTSVSGHVTAISGAATPRSPDSDDSGRGRSSEDGGPIDPLVAAIGASGQHIPMGSRSGVVCREAWIGPRATSVDKASLDAQKTHLVPPFTAAASFDSRLTVPEATKGNCFRHQPRDRVCRNQMDDMVLASAGPRPPSRSPSPRRGLIGAPPRRVASSGDFADCNVLYLPRTSSALMKSPEPMSDFRIADNPPMMTSSYHLWQQPGMSRCGVRRAPPSPRLAPFGGVRYCGSSPRSEDGGNFPPFPPPPPRSSFEQPPPPPFGYSLPASARQRRREIMLPERHQLSCFDHGPPTAPPRFQALTLPPPVVRCVVTGDRVVKRVVPVVSGVRTMNKAASPPSECNKDLSDEKSWRTSVDSDGSTSDFLGRRIGTGADTVV